MTPPAHRLIDHLLEEARQPIELLLSGAEQLAAEAAAGDGTRLLLADVAAQAGRLLSFVETKGLAAPGDDGESDVCATLLAVGEHVHVVRRSTAAALAHIEPGPSRDAIRDGLRHISSVFSSLSLISPLTSIVGELADVRTHAAAAAASPWMDRILGVGDRLLDALQADLLRPSLAALGQWDYKRISYEVRELLSPLIGYAELALEQPSDSDPPPDPLRLLVSDSGRLLMTLDTLAAVAMIESRLAHIQLQIDQFLSELAGSENAPSATSDEETGLPDFAPAAVERFAAQWASFVPRDVQVRAATATFLCAKYRLSVADMPGICAACGLDDPDLALAHRRLLRAIPSTEIVGASPSTSDIWALQERAGWLNLSRGEVLFRQGDPADRLYFLVSGRLRVVVRDQDGVDRALAEVTRGEAVDEMAVLMDEHRSASVFALRDSELLTLSKATFDSLCQDSPQLMRHFTTQVVTRLRNAIGSSPESRPPANAIAVVPADPNVPLDLFCRRLCEALSLHGSVMSMTKAAFDQALPETKADADSAVAASWLNSQEQRHRFVVYAADGPATAWSRRCLRQADRILLVASAGRREPLSRTAQMVLDAGVDSPVRRDLVLIQAGAGPGSEWRGDRRFARRYNVDLNSHSEIARLARCQVGAAVGLVLGAGAARGFAHIGVLRALQEAGVEVDLIGGTSMGALVGAAYALGFTWERMLRELLPPRAVLADFSFPAIALTRGVRFREWIHSWVGDRHIEDLRTSFFCVSSNLTRAEANVHASGPLLKALMASNALPGMVPPVIEGGDLLVDGGLLANVPTGAMRAIPDVGYVIAVDTVPAVELADNEDYGLGVSGWRILREKLMPGRRPRIPGIFSIELRAQQVPSLAARKSLARSPGDLYLALPLEKFSFLDYRRLRDIADTGYRAAAPLVAEWKARTLDAVGSAHNRAHAEHATR